VSAADELERLRVALAECEGLLERERRFGHRVTDLTTSLLLVLDADGTIVPGGAEAIAGRATIPVEVSVEPGDRPSESVEAAAYYVVAEALTNAQKHSRASVVRVTVSRSGGHLRLEVTSSQGRGTRLTARIPL
jgi:signal transduction histidine kinase